MNYNLYVYITVIRLNLKIFLDYYYQILFHEIILTNIPHMHFMTQNFFHILYKISIINKSHL